MNCSKETPKNPEEKTHATQRYMGKNEGTTLCTITKWEFMFKVLPNLQSKILKPVK